MFLMQQELLQDWFNRHTVGSMTSTISLYNISLLEANVYYSSPVRPTLIGLTDATYFSAKWQVTAMVDSQKEYLRHGKKILSLKLIQT